MSTSPVRTAAGFALAAGLFILPCGPLSAATEIRTSVQRATEPKFIAVNRSGKSEAIGLCMDIMQSIERVEPNLKFVIDHEWDSLIRLEASLAAGQIDALCGLVRNKERAAKFQFIEPPLFPMHYYLAVRADDNVRVNSWDDVRNLGDQGVILVISGYGVIRTLQAMGGLKVDASGDDAATNIQKLLAERGRFFYHRSPGIKADIRNAGATDKIKILPTPMDSQQYYMVLAKTVPPETVEKMRKAIAQLESSGELKRLLEKWERY